jgi:rhomboid protease GluP
MITDVPLAVQDVSATVQQLLLAHGARYAHAVSEDSWKFRPLTLIVPSPPQGRLPLDSPLTTGAWHIVPWRPQTAAHLEAWLQRLPLAGPLPAVVVLIAEALPVDTADLWSLSAQSGIDLVGFQTASTSLLGRGPAAKTLRQLADPEVQRLIAEVNPLVFLQQLGDPQDDEVFLERLRRASRGIPVTTALVTANIAVFVWMVLASRAFPVLVDGPGGTGPVGVLDLPWSQHLFRILLAPGFSVGQLSHSGANLAGLTVTAGETWRLLTCTFVHANLLHIGMNLYVLRGIGQTAERLFGPAVFLLVYLLAGLGGSVASLGFTLAQQPAMPSVGASGAVFGAMGATLGFALARRKQVPRDVYKSLLRSGLGFALLNIVFGLSMPMIDNAAHMGGLATGVLAGALLSRQLPPAPQPALTWRIAATGLVAALLGVAFQLAAARVNG